MKRILEAEKVAKKILTEPQYWPKPGDFYLLADAVIELLKRLKELEEVVARLEGQPKNKEE